MLRCYKSGHPFYSLEFESKFVGMVYCSKYSKGGHLENLAVDPDYQGLGFAGKLVKTLIDDNPGVITLTTRISKYFEGFGFVEVKKLDDGATFMYLVSPEEQRTSRMNITCPVFTSLSQT